MSYHDIDYDDEAEEVARVIDQRPPSDRTIYCLDLRAAEVATGARRGSAQKELILPRRGPLGAAQILHTRLLLHEYAFARRGRAGHRRREGRGGGRGTRVTD